MNRINEYLNFFIFVNRIEDEIDKELSINRSVSLKIYPNLISSLLLEAAYYEKKNPTFSNFMKYINNITFSHTINDFVNEILPNEPLIKYCSRLLIKPKTARNIISKIVGKNIKMRKINKTITNIIAERVKYQNDVSDKVLSCIKKSFKDIKQHCDEEDERRREYILFHNKYEIETEDPHNVKIEDIIGPMNEQDFIVDERIEELPQHKQIIVKEKRKRFSCLFCIPKKQKKNKNKLVIDDENKKFKKVFTIFKKEKTKENEYCQISLSCQNISVDCNNVIFKLPDGSKLNISINIITRLHYLYTGMEDVNIELMFQNKNFVEDLYLLIMRYMPFLNIEYLDSNLENVVNVFATPLTSYEKNYISLFDEDKIFGSLGSVFTTQYNFYDDAKYICCVPRNKYISESIIRNCLDTKTLKTKITFKCDREFTGILVYESYMKVCELEIDNTYYYYIYQ